MAMSARHILENLYKCVTEIPNASNEKWEQRDKYPVIVKFSSQIIYKTTGQKKSVKI